jgi:excisionase family DNA binding protein
MEVAVEMPANDEIRRADGQRPRFFTVAQVAQLLGLSESTLFRAIRAGEFPAIKVRGRYVVPGKAIDLMESSALATALVDGAGRTPWRVAPGHLRES